MTGQDRCARASQQREESLAGSASTVRTFLLLEWAGPWGEHALRSPRLPHRLRRHLSAAARSGVRVLAIRRHGSRDGDPGSDEPGGAPREASRTIFVAHAAPTGARLERAEVDDLEDLLGVDWEALAAGRWPGATEVADPVLCVCTHGRHDPCCAERGRPLAAALHAAHPDLTWEVSHIGGDRFAGNVLVLPDGLYYGRLTPTAALELVEGHLRGSLDLDHLRGRSSLPMPAQAAEIFLRRELSERRADAVRPGPVSRQGEETVSRFETDDAAYDVRVRTTLASLPERLTCRATGPSRAPVHELVAVEQVLH